MSPAIPVHSQVRNQPPPIILDVEGGDCVSLTFYLEPGPAVPGTSLGQTGVSGVACVPYLSKALLCWVFRAAAYAQPFFHSTQWP